MSGKCALWPLRFLTTVILLESPHSRAFASWTQTSFQSSWGPRVSTEHLGRKATGDRKAVSVSPGFSVSSPFPLMYLVCWYEECLYYFLIIKLTRDLTLSPLCWINHSVTLWSWVPNNGMKSRRYLHWGKTEVIWVRVFASPVCTPILKKKERRNQLADLLLPSFSPAPMNFLCES